MEPRGTASGAPVLKESLGSMESLGSSDMLDFAETFDVRAELRDSACCLQLTHSAILELEKNATQSIAQIGKLE